MKFCFWVLHGRSYIAGSALARHTTVTTRDTQSGLVSTNAVAMVLRYQTYYKHLLPTPQLRHIQCTAIAPTPGGGVPRTQKLGPLC